MDPLEPLDKPTSTYEYDPLDSIIPLYEYRPLDPDSSEIRLIDIIPGTEDDPIRLEIRHVGLVGMEAAVAKQDTISRDVLEADLPSNWALHETIEGRFIFIGKRGKEDTAPNRSSWEHPVTGKEPPPGFVPEVETREATQSYEALSYFWGYDGEDVSVVMIDKDVSPGQNSIYALNIRPNLASILAYLREPDYKRTLWVDAICINQNDDVEKGVQVSRNGEIYRLAKRTICYVGPPYDDCDIAIRELEWLGSLIELTSNGASFVMTPDCTYPDIMIAARPLPFDDQAWEAIDSFVRRPWFNRVWVTQEVKLAKANSVLQSGHDTISLSLFRKAVDRTTTNPSLLPLDKHPHLARALRGDLATVFPPGRESFIHELFTISRKDCSDTRDIIYGYVIIKLN